MSIEENPGFSEESLRRIAAQKVKYRLLLRFHAITYIMVNILLTILNYVTNASYYWFVFPLLGWLIGLSIHAIAYYCYANGIYPMMKRISYIHLIAFITTMLLLLVIDSNIMNGFQFEGISWSIYPAISWGFPVLLHVIVTKTVFSGKMTEDGLIKTRRERAVEKEMQKMKKKFGEYPK
ncbi:MAG: 2TM domain-containing protein [Candidatus Lokiarchaeota archaeon]|nr:2TM domain-containing protein [Candidatus Lokiarchaeota archaeon]